MVGDDIDVDDTPEPDDIELSPRWQWQFNPPINLGHRQRVEQRTKVGELPWWATTKPGEMTKTAERERKRKG